MGFGVWTTVADQSGGRDNNFNLLRMLAALGVLVSHSIPVTGGPDAPQILEGTLKGVTLGDACVLIFFAVSGFFITQSFDRSRSLVSFVTNRVLRIFPALLVMLTLTVLAAGLWVTMTRDLTFWSEGLSYLLRNLLLFFSAPNLPGVFESHPFSPIVNSSLWTLSYEVICYGFVLICGVMGLFSGPRIFLIVLSLFAAALGIKASMDLGTRFETTLYLGLPFVIGMTVYVWRAYVPLTFWLVAVLAVLTTLLRNTELFLPMLIVALSYGSILLGFASLPKLKAYNRLGDYSYGTYIYAFPLQQTGFALGFSDPLSNVIFALPLAVFCAVLSWHAVEHPALGLKRWIAAPRPA
ncbi:acyltransferase family protein [Roseovarius phycicola]|uniref:Acyltransferase n=1 Tax=Roseovarius phycicola TaxID=3080976 RepID=A0ABZ2HG82_9RHOB